MTNILFVCYHHGCKGERLSVKLSEHKRFMTLKYKKVHGRTIIENDIFEKKLLGSHAPVFSDLYNHSGHNIVVPSHRFYDEINKYYPDDWYVSIDLPKNLDEYATALYQRFYKYRTNDIRELIGECKDKFLMYRPTSTKQEVKDFVASILKTKNVTFGDITCLAMGIPANEKNQLMLAHERHLRPLSNMTKENSLVIAYEDVDKITAEDVVNYFRRSMGSL